jgi:hypothetical protein
MFGFGLIADRNRDSHREQKSRPKSRPHKSRTRPRASQPVENRRKRTTLHWDHAVTNVDV